MGILADNFRNHPIHQTIETTLQYISDRRKSENLADAEKDSLDAYEQLITYAKYVMENNVTQVVPSQLISSLDSNISKLQNNNVLNIESTYNLYTNITSDLAKIPTYNDKNVVRAGIGKIIENFSKEKENIKNTISAEVECFKQIQSDELENWKKEKAGYEEQLETLKAQKEDLTKELESLTEKLDTERQEISSLIISFKEKYDIKVADLKKTFVDNEEEREKIFKEFCETNKTKTDVLLQYMKEKQDAVEQLWGIIGKAAVSGSSQNYANNAKNFAHFMTFLALCIMGLAIWSLVDVVQEFIKIKISTKDIQIDSTFLIIRLILNIVMFFPAWYCANIANKQRNREFQLRDFEIKTAGLEPFMENMKMVKYNVPEGNQNKKDEIKLELVRDIFQNVLNKKKVDDANIIIPKDILETLKSCLETWSKIRGK